MKLSQYFISIFPLGLLILSFFEFSCKPSNASEKTTSFVKEVSLSENAFTSSNPKTANTSTKRKTGPQLVWAYDEIKFWAYDNAQIDHQRWNSEWTTHFKAIRQFTAYQKDFQLEVFAYPSIEDKAIRTRNMRLAHTEKNELHLVSNALFKGEEWGEQYRPLIQAALGEAQYKVLETGLMMQWCGQIKDQNITHWVTLLTHAKALPNLTTLYDNEGFDLAPPFATKLAAASWVSYCLEHWGKEWLLEHYQNLSPPRSILEQWNKEWKEWILATSPLAISRVDAYNGGQLKGFTLAHEGYRIYNGYGSALAKKSIERLVSLGTNAIAIVPYSFMRSPYHPTHIPTVNGPGMENDESVLFAHFTAKSLGQFTLLKPQVWIHNGWPGDIDFNNNKEWQQFFNYYRRWIMHYALLAEMNHIDALCIGTEMKQTTLKHPEFWRALIKDIRKMYHGSLTYAANWGEECEKITFWEELDYIGVNCYYPLYAKKDATEEDLRQGVQKNLAKIEKIQRAFQRPVWLTEVGFRSATAPWVQPHAEAQNREIDDQAQALCYEVLLSELEKNKWVTGLFWWKWPSYLSSNESHGRGYMPLNKPAEEVLKKYYLKE